MAPRPIGELVSIIFHSDDVATFGKAYMQHIKELYMYSKDDITTNLVLVNFTHAMELRSFLLSHFLKIPKLAEELVKHGMIHKIDNESVTTRRQPTYTAPRICNRYKENYAHNDIYFLSISLLEGSIHQDLLKGVLLPPQNNTPSSKPDANTKQKSSVTTPKSTATTTVVTTSPAVSTAISTSAGSSTNSAYSNSSAQIQEELAQPLLNNSGAAVIENLSALRSLVVGLHNDNKTLINKINQLTTKVDNQGNELRNQASEIKQLRTKLQTRSQSQAPFDNVSTGSASQVTIHPPARGGIPLHMEMLAAMLLIATILLLSTSVML